MASPLPVSRIRHKPMCQYAQRHLACDARAKKELNEVGEYSEGIDATAGEDLLVIANRFNNSVSIVDPQALSVIDTIKACDGPTCLWQISARRKTMKASSLIAALFCVLASPAWASSEAWENVRALLYGDQPMQNGDALIAIDAPYRTPDDARAELAAQVVAPRGTKVAKVSLVLDENPMPVSAVFELVKPLPSFYFDVTMRVNGPTPMHIIAETTDGRLWVSETFVKTSGLGACAAPPGTDPKLALENLGTMEAELVGRVPALGTLTRLTNLGADRSNKMDLNIDHPSNSGMQMDQISLLFIPMRYVETVDIDLDSAGYVQMTGSISLSENPRVGISVPSRAQTVDVTMTDTDGTVSHLHKKLAGF